MREEVQDGAWVRLVGRRIPSREALLCSVLYHVLTNYTNYLEGQTGRIS